MSEMTYALDGLGVWMNSDFRPKNVALCEDCLRSLSAVTRSIFNLLAPNEMYLIMDITMRERFYAK